MIEGEVVDVQIDRPTTVCFCFFSPSLFLFLKPFPVLVRSLDWRSWCADCVHVHVLVHVHRACLLCDARAERLEGGQDDAEDDGHGDGVRPRPEDDRRDHQGQDPGRVRAPLRGQTPAPSPAQPLHQPASYTAR